MVDKIDKIEEIRKKIREEMFTVEIMHGMRVDTDGRLNGLNRALEIIDSVIKTEDILSPINQRVVDAGCVRVEEFDIKNGGIYIETTEDPRGWMLGDKTRKRYNATIAQVMSLTNLLITFHSSDNGDRIKVKVHNPKDVSMMLLSKNDDVGSSVEYADIYGDIEPISIVDIGRHVYIEPMINRNSIRIQIFPGRNMINNGETIYDK